MYTYIGWDHVQSGWYVEPVTLQKDRDISSSSSIINDSNENNNMNEINDGITNDNNTNDNTLINNEINNTHAINSENNEEKINEKPSFLYDNPFMSAQVLRGFYTAHSEVLSTLPLANGVCLEKYEEFLSTFKASWIRTRSLR